MVIYRDPPCGARGRFWQFPPFVGLGVEPVGACGKPAAVCRCSKGLWAPEASKRLWTAAPASDFEEPSMAAAAPAASIGFFEAVPRRSWLAG